MCRIGSGNAMGAIKGRASRAPYRGIQPASYLEPVAREWEHVGRYVSENRPKRKATVVESRPGDESLG